jgi:hypothetical protein
MMHILPEKQSPIIHSIVSGRHTGGLEATIFHFNPQEADDTLMETEPSVYLQSTQRGQIFQPFPISKLTAFVLPLGIYLSLLCFVKEEWKKINDDMDKKIEVMKILSFPKTFKKNIFFTSHGCVVYERWFDLLFFHYKKSSLNESENYIHLQIQNVSMQIDPIVLYNLASQYDSLVEILTRIGYKYCGPVGQNLQL